MPHASDLLHIYHIQRKEISFAVNTLSKINAQPGEEHLRALVHLLMHIRYHSKLGLKLYSDQKKCPVYNLLK
jgi:hypothetical protein